MMENNNLPDFEPQEKTVSVDDVIMPELPDVPDVSSIIMPEQNTVINSDIPMPESAPDISTETPMPDGSVASFVQQTPQYNVHSSNAPSSTTPGQSQQTPQYGYRAEQPMSQAQTPTYNYNSHTAGSASVSGQGGIPVVPTAGSNQPQGVFGVNSKSKVTAGLLGIFFGCFGAHNFYLGYKATAIIQLCLTIIAFGCGGIFISFIWSFIEAILIFTGSISCDAYGNPIE